MMCARGEAEIMSTRHRIANIQHFHSIMHIDSIYIGHPASHHARDFLLRPNKKKKPFLSHAVAVVAACMRQIFQKPHATEMFNSQHTYDDQDGLVVRL